MITDPQIEEYCKAHTQDESPLLREVREYTYAHVSAAHMISDILVGRLLQFLIRAAQAKFVLDLGTFTGYSALSIAEALPADGIVLTCDKSLEHLQIARGFFAKSLQQEQIKIFEGLAADCIADIRGLIDLAFVDADKMPIKEYIDALYPKLKPGGFIIVDNVLWDGEILNPQDTRGQALAQLNDTIKKDERFGNVLLPVRDGLNIMCKL